MRIGGMMIALAFRDSWAIQYRPMGSGFGGSAQSRSTAVIVTDN